MQSENVTLNLEISSATSHALDRISKSLERPTIKVASFLFALGCYNLARKGFSPKEDFSNPTKEGGAK